MIQCLLIDDDQDDQEIFSMCVTSISSQIIYRGIDDSAEAISILTADEIYTPHYIFIDVNMPKINGIECLKALKKIERLHKTRIFMYSTTSESSTLAESKRLGAHDFIIKLPQFSALKDRLSKIFDVTV